MIHRRNEPLSFRLLDKNKKLKKLKDRVVKMDKTDRIGYNKKKFYKFGDYEIYSISGHLEYME